MSLIFIATKEDEQELLFLLQTETWTHRQGGERRGKRKKRGRRGGRGRGGERGGGGGGGERIKPNTALCSRFPNVAHRCILWPCSLEYSVTPPHNEKVWLMFPALSHVAGLSLQPTKF